MVGRTLGHYEIIEPLGAGGMGEVYRAHDTILKRDVAIKVLPEDLSADVERLARLEREAQLLAALNHPNIATIHGLDEAKAEDGVSTRFMVLELIEGESLAEMLSRGRMEVKKTLGIARQIAEALEAAHSKGIIHRDLKPGNVVITPEGQAKVLDFGLAKSDVTEGTSPEVPPDITESPTVAAATMAGIILGTAAYMSPEQARGKPLDKRTDIWSFGCVLYEMLTGRRPFDGETVTDVLAAIVEREPDWSAVPDGVPLAIHLLLRRCLEKDPYGRLHDIADARIEIVSAISAPEGGLPSTASSSSTRNGAGRAISLRLAVPLAIMIAAASALGVWIMRPRLSEPFVSRFQMQYPPGTSYQGIGSLGVAISPDGRWIVFSDNQRLWCRAIGDLEAVPLNGTEGARMPFFSADGTRLGFWADDEIRSVAITGGAPVAFSPATVPVIPYGVSWAENGDIYYGQRASILRVSEGESRPEVVMEANTGDLLRVEQMLPGGEWLLFTLRKAGTSWSDAQISALSLDTGEVEEVLSGGTNARYIPTGHLVYSVDTDLLAVPLDIDSLSTIGSPAAVAQNVRQSVTGAGYAHYAVSESGTLVHMMSSGAVERQLAWVNREGAEELVPAEKRAYYAVRLSPDGKRVAIDLQDPTNRDVWIYDLERDTFARLTFGPGRDTHPIWTPDGSRVIYASDRDGTVRNLYWRAADGTGQPERLTTSPNTQNPFAVTPDGALVVFRETGDTTGYDIGVLSLDEDRTVEMILSSPYDEHNPALSPDGRWIAYESNESGEFEIYVRPFPDVGANKLTISQDGGRYPLWDPGGPRLLYRAQAGMMSVAFEPGDTLVPGQAELLFSVTGVLDGVTRSYDIHPADQRFLFVKVEPGAESRLQVVLNWFEELQRLVPREQ